VTKPCIIRRKRTVPKGTSTTDEGISPMKRQLALLSAAAMLALAAAPASAQMRALNDPVVPHPNPESLFTSDDPVLHRNKQTALHIQRNLLKCNEWNRAG